MDLLPAAMLAAGAASGVHCVGMCGGIVAVFDLRRVIPIVARRPRVDPLRRVLFNLGRITSYAAAGAIAGAFGAAAVAAGLLPAQSVLQVAASVLLLLVGLHLAGAGGLLSRLESVGAPLWRRLQPLAARLLDAPTPARAYAAGLAWGWLPCAMVYAALGAATFSGGVLQGALAMAAFGFGTLPFLLAAGWIASRLRAWRRVAGVALLGFGAYGLAHAGTLGEGIRRGLLCL
jgi:sulfite exporter TauE/SafE